MKRLLAIFLVLFLIPAFAYTASTGKPKMVIDQQTFDAGEVWRSAEKIEHTFVVKNTGDAPLNILSATPG